MSTQTLREVAATMFMTRTVCIPQIKLGANVPWPSPCGEIPAGSRCHHKSMNVCEFDEPYVIITQSPWVKQSIIWLHGTVCRFSVKLPVVGASVNLAGPSFAIRQRPARQSVIISASLFQAGPVHQSSVRHSVVVILTAPPSLLNYSSSPLF